MFAQMLPHTCKIRTVTQTGQDASTKEPLYTQQTSGTVKCRFQMLASNHTLEIPGSWEKQTLKLFLPGTVTVNVECDIISTTSQFPGTFHVDGVNQIAGLNGKVHHYECTLIPSLEG